MLPLCNQVHQLKSRNYMTASAACIDALALLHLRNCTTNQVCCLKGHARFVEPVMCFFASVLTSKGIIYGSCDAGCELPPTVVTERDWAKEQRKFAAPAMGGRGRVGGYSSGGRSAASGGRGCFAARYGFSPSVALDLPGGLIAFLIQALMPCPGQGEWTARLSCIVSSFCLNMFATV